MQLKNKHKTVSGTQFKTLVFPLIYYGAQLHISSPELFSLFLSHLQLGLSVPFRYFQALLRKMLLREQWRGIAKVGMSFLLGKVGC